MVDAAGGKARRTGIAKSAVATGRGDDGTTGLLYGGRVPKDDPRADAYGTIDEAVAALGLARVEAAALAEGPSGSGGSSGSDGAATLAALILRLQRELFVAGAELAANPDAWDRLQDGVTRVDEPMLVELERSLATYESGIEMPREFIVPGETRLSAALELARSVTRRAERRATTLQRHGQVAGPWLLPYLNRLADLLWVLARAAEQTESRRATTVREGPARTTVAKTG